MMTVLNRKIVLRFGPGRREFFLQCECSHNPLLRDHGPFLGCHWRINATGILGTF